MPGTVIIDLAAVDDEDEFPAVPRTGAGAGHATALTGDCLICMDPVAPPPGTRKRGKGPVVCPGCSCVMHDACVREMLEMGFPGPHISFSFLNCPNCRVRYAPRVVVPPRVSAHSLPHTAAWLLYSVWNEELWDGLRNAGHVRRGRCP